MSFGEDMEILETSYIVGGNVKNIIIIRNPDNPVK